MKSDKMYSNKIGPILFQSWFDWIFQIIFTIYVCLSCAGITFSQSSYGLSRNKNTDRTILRASGTFCVKIKRSESHQPINCTSHKYGWIWASRSQFSPEFQMVCGFLYRTKTFYFIFMLLAECAQAHTPCVSDKPQRGFFPFNNVFWVVRW